MRGYPSPVGGPHTRDPLARLEAAEGTLPFTDR